MLLADAAQEVGGKLYILGGGWSVTGPVVGPTAIAIKVDVPWNDANRRHHFKLSLVGEDGGPPAMINQDGEVQQGDVSFEGELEVGRPPGISPGTDIDAALAINLGPLPLVPGRRYVWQLAINGQSPEEWHRPFSVRTG